VANRRRSPSAMVLTREPPSPRLKSKSTRRSVWPGVDANRAEMPHSATAPTAASLLKSTILPHSSMPPNGV